MVRPLSTCFHKPFIYSIFYLFYLSYVFCIVFIITFTFWTLSFLWLSIVSSFSYEKTTKISSLRDHSPPIALSYGCNVARQQISSSLSSHSKSQSWHLYQTSCVFSFVQFQFQFLKFSLYTNGFYDLSSDLIVLWR